MAAEYEYIPIIYKNNNKKEQYIHKYSNRSANRSKFSAYSLRASDYKNNADNMRVSGNYSAAAVAFPVNTAAGNTKTKKAFKAKGVFSVIMVIALVFLMLTVVLAGNTQISNNAIGNAAISKEIEVLNQEIDDLKLDITLGQDLGYIQERAAQMGMHTPSADQIVYL